MSAVRLSIRYAQSLQDLALETGKHDTVRDDVKLLVQTADASSELKSLLHSPVIRPNKKQTILNSIFQGKVDDITMKFINIVVNKGREKYLLDIAKSFIDLYNRHNNITPVRVTTAVEMSEETNEKIRQALVNKTSIEKVEMSTKVDEDIIGGFVLNFDDKLYDASVAHKLNVLKKDLTSNQYIKNL